MNDYIQFLDYKYERKLRNRKVKFKLDGYDTDTVIMALKKFAIELRSDVKKLLEGDSIGVYSETVKRLYSAEFLADYLMEKAGEVMQKEQEEQQNETK